MTYPTPYMQKQAAVKVQLLKAAAYHTALASQAFQQIEMIEKEAAMGAGGRAGVGALIGGAGGAGLGALMAPEGKGGMGALAGGAGGALAGAGIGASMGGGSEGGPPGGVGAGSAHGIGEALAAQRMADIVASGKSIDQLSPEDQEIAMLFHKGELGPELFQQQVNTGIQGGQPQSEMDPEMQQIMQAFRMQQAAKGR